MFDTVTNAFRRGVRLGAVLSHITTTTCCVTNAFRRGVRLGVARRNDSIESLVQSPMPFGGEYGWEVGLIEQARDNIRSPMPFGGEYGWEALEVN